MGSNILQYLPAPAISQKNTEVNQSVFGSYLWASFFHKISMQALILLCSCLRRFTVNLPLDFQIFNICRIRVLFFFFENLRRISKNNFSTSQILIAISQWFDAM